MTQDTPEPERARAEDGAHADPPAMDDTGEIPAVPADAEPEAPAATEADLEDASQDATEDAETDERRPGE